MSSSTADVKNWMHMFRWIVKMIRDEFDIDERHLTRNAVLETDLGLSVEQIERVLDLTALGFDVRFPNTTLDEVARLEELCLVTSWLRGLYKGQPSSAPNMKPCAAPSTPAHPPRCEPVPFLSLGLICLPRSRCGTAGVQRAHYLARAHIDNPHRSADLPSTEGSPAMGLRVRWPPSIDQATR